MPAKIQEVVTAQKLIRKFALVGQITPQLDETIAPVVVLDDLSDVEEWAYGFFWEQRAAAALEFNTWSLENVAGSGQVLELLDVKMATAAGADTFAAVVNALTLPLATLLVPVLQDLRGEFFVPNRFPPGEVRREGLPGMLPGFLVWGQIVAANTEAVFTPAQTLVYPGTRIFFQHRTLNRASSFSIQWRGRALHADGT